MTEQQEQDRKEALSSAFDALTSYLTDHCPDNVNWEDFDPQIDAVRFHIQEELNDEA
ncbi:hypothetical protein [Mesorhizobium sp. WSM2239]|uniref:Uncharacterized protein n=2 Tax=unclassified Mesorhizobium TaxID=325217 RepID=A0AAU8DFT0_9HYPH